MAGRSRSWLISVPAAAADKVHHFKPVAIFERGCLPLGAGNDFQVQLHGNAVRLHAKLADQRSHGQAVRKVALFAVDVEEHGKQLALSNCSF